MRRNRKTENGNRYRGNAPRTSNHSRLKLLCSIFLQNRHNRKIVSFRALDFMRDKKNPCFFFLLTLTPTRVTDALFCASTPSLSVSRHVFTYLRSFRYRASAFTVHLILRPSSSSPSPPPPPPPPPSSSSASVSSSSTSSFFTFHQRRRLAVLLSSFLFLFLPMLLLLIPHDQTTTTATNNHLVPLRSRERRCRCAR